MKDVYDHKPAWIYTKHCSVFNIWLVSSHAVSTFCILLCTKYSILIKQLYIITISDGHNDLNSVNVYYYVGNVSDNNYTWNNIRYIIEITVY